MKPVEVGQKAFWFDFRFTNMGSSVIKIGRSEGSLFPYFYQFRCHYPLITYLIVYHIIPKHFIRTAKKILFIAENHVYLNCFLLVCITPYLWALVFHMQKIFTVFPHIVFVETILFWIWKSKGHKFGAEELKGII